MSFNSNTKIHKTIPAEPNQINSVMPSVIIPSVYAVHRPISPKQQLLTSTNDNNDTCLLSNKPAAATGKNHPIERLSKRKRTVLLPIILITFLLSCTAIILSVIFLHVLRQQSSSVTDLVASTCSLATCIGLETPYRTSIVTALYPFDGNSNDLSGHLSGVPYGSPVPGYGAATSYIDQAIDLDPVNRQYIRIPAVNFRQRSFTIQLWLLIRSGASASDYALFSQCGSDSICLSISIRNLRVAFSFDSMNSSERVLTGATVLSKSYWYHVTVLYDVVLQQQFIYVNGRLDGLTHSVEPYQGTLTSAMTYIGSNSSVQYQLSFFHGYIDHFTISAGMARTACQILNDASLIAYYPFDTTDTLLDRGVYLIHGIASRLTTESSGRLGQSISFQFATSYFQSSCFPTIRPASLPISVSLWVKPTVTVGGASLIHVSTLQNGTGSGCYDLLGFTGSGVLVAQLMTSPTTVLSTSGIALPLSTWTHVGIVYSSANGLCLFVNGQLTDSVVGSMAVNQYNLYVTLGNSSPGLSVSSSACTSSTIAAGSYRGSIDEFRIYNRELDADELCVLANP